jgi:hypothetical protein
MVNNWEPNHIVVFKKVKPLQQSQQTHKHVFFLVSNGLLNWKTYIKYICNMNYMFVYR